MKNRVKNNPTLSRFGRWLTGLGVYAFLQSFLFYYFTSTDMDLAPVCGSSFLAGSACLLISMKSIKAIKSLASAEKLDISFAKFIAWESLTINSIFIVLGTTLSLIGFYPDVGETPGEFLSGLALYLGMFFPLNVLALGNSLRALLFLRQQPEETSSPERISNDQLKREIINSVRQPVEVIDEVWVSSTQHLQKWSECVASTPEHIIKEHGYNIPEGFPHFTVKISTFKQMKFPGTIFSRGSLAIGDEGIAFQALGEPPRWGIIKLKISNLDEDFKFMLGMMDIYAIEWFRHHEGVLSEFNYDWIKLETNFGELLLLAGGYGLNIERIKKRTQKLFDKIHLNWQNSRT